MEENDLKIWLTTNRDKFPQGSLTSVKNNLEGITFEQLDMFYMKEPLIALVLSVVVGYLGVDRFYNGQIGLGLLKLFTLGGLGVWTVIDWFLIMPAIRQSNYDNLTLLAKI